MAMKLEKVSALRKVQPKLAEALGACWTLKIVLSKECAELDTFDPPCAYLEAQCRLGRIYICRDGEIYMYGYKGLEVANLDVCQPIVPQIITLLRERFDLDADG
jgi:hypothetical protein